MRKLLVRIALASFVVLVGLAPARAFLVTDITGDGVAVTVNAQDDLSCSSSHQIEVVIEGKISKPGDGFQGITFRLVDPADVLLMEVHIPESTIDAMPPPLPPADPFVISGVFHLWFNLHCDDLCQLEGRFGDVGSPSSFVYKPQGGPTGPTFSLGRIGGDGGPENAGIPIVAVGASGASCVTLAIETHAGGTQFTGGANEACCSGPLPRPIPPTMTVGKAAPGFINVFYDVVTCNASEHALFYGTLSSFGQVTAAECLIGASGTHVTAPPAGDTWFLVAGREGNLYSSVGQATAGERVLEGVEELCGPGFVSDTSATCP